MRLPEFVRATSWLRRAPLVALALGSATACTSPQQKMPAETASTSESGWYRVALDREGAEVHARYADVFPPFENEPAYDIVELRIDFAAPLHSDDWGWNYRSTLESWRVDCAAGVGAKMATSYFERRANEGRRLLTADAVLRSSDDRPTPEVRTICTFPQLRHPAPPRSR